MGYSYDENGNLQTRTDARKIATTYGYDDLNRPSSRTYTAPAGVPATPPVNFYYDAQPLPSGAPSFNRGPSTGRLVAVLYGGTSSTTGNYTGYDAVGRPIVSFQKTDTSVYRMDYGYDLSGEMISETYPGTAGTNRRVVRTEYDAAGRIAGIRNGATGPYYAGDATNRIAYTSHGAISKMKLGNGLWAHTDFNARLQPIQIGLGTADSGAGSTSVLGLDYTYGMMAGAVLDTTKNNGNIESQTINAGSLVLKQSYTYDQVNRLVQATEKMGVNLQWQQIYDYDIWGNRAVRVGSHIPVPRQTPTSNSPSDLSFLFNQTTNRISATTDYGYDAAGNLSSTPNTTSGADTMAFDGENRQLSYTKAGGGPTNYSYEGEGRRIKKVDSGTTVFVYDVSGKLIAEYTTALPSGPGGTSYLTTDHLGSTRVVTTAGPSPAVNARYDYLPFGEQIASSIGNRSSVAGYVPNDSTRQKFTQKERDTESGLDYFLARYYSSAQGRFTSPDALMSSARPELPQSWNRYVYCLSNPLVYIDPGGFDWYRSIDNPDQPIWLDSNNPGEGYRRSSLVYQSGNQWIKLDQYSNNWTGGFESKQAALDYESISDMILGFLHHEVGDVKESANRLFSDPLGVLTSPEVQATFVFAGLPGLGATGEGFGVASGVAGEAAEMSVVRTIGQGEKIADIVNEAKVLTFETGNEHALVKLASGERALVSGGEGGINFAEGQITRLYGHSHPYQFNATGASDIDRAALLSLGQRSSWLLEHGSLTKFGR